MTPPDRSRNGRPQPEPQRPTPSPRPHPSSSVPPRTRPSSSVPRRPQPSVASQRPPYPPTTPHRPSAGSGQPNGHPPAGQRPSGSRPPQKKDPMQQSYSRYRKRQRRRKKLNRFWILLAVLIVIVVILFLCIRACSKEKPSSEEPSAASAVSQIVSSAESSVPEVPSGDASVTESHPSSAEDRQKSSKTSNTSNTSETSQTSQTSGSELTYNNPHQYTVNYQRFSDETIYELDENITSEFVALYDVTADEVIYSHNYSKKCYPASTTKLLTAITANRIITDPNKVITVGDEIYMIGEESSIAYLQEGMQLTFEMLLDALLLPSGNDAAYTIAVNCGRIHENDPKLSNEAAVKVFMKCVNETAQQIGATHTHYVTPDGWHDDDHYTSAEDLVKIGDYAKSIPLIAKSCSKPYVEWELVKGGSIAWSNSNKLIQFDSGVYSEYCDGLKTGFTDQAGTSVVASATMGGHTFVAVTMNGLTLYTKYNDCNLMFQKAFALYDLNYTYG